MEKGARRLLEAGMGLLKTAYQTNLIAFFDKVIKLVDKGNAMDVVYLDFI